MPSLIQSVVILFLIAPTTLWLALAIFFQTRSQWARLPITLMPILIVVFSVWYLPFLPWALMVWLILFGLALVWWSSLHPTSQGEWIDGMGLLPRVHIDGDRVCIQNFRNFDYDSLGNPRPCYEERTFDLSMLRSLDYFLSNISGPFIVHTMVSFGFDDGQYLMISVEARRRPWQSYSPFRGMFRNYTLMYVLGDERDIIRLRTNIRKESVYMYRLSLTVPHMRALLLDYLERAQALTQRAEWYHSFLSNCTTNLFYHRHRKIRIGFKLGIFINGLSARLLYRLGALANDVPFREIRARSDIRALAQAADKATDFSQRIRTCIVPLDQWHIPGR